MRLHQCLNAASEKLQKAGVDSPRLCAAVLVRMALERSSATAAHLFCLVHENRELTERERRVVDFLVRRRAEGRPLAHITGRKEFYGRDFLVSRHTLIPRPETELLVDTALCLFPAHHILFADMGTGCGCIGLTLAAERPLWHGVLADINPQTVEVAKRNTGRLGLGTRVVSVRSDMFSPSLLPDSLDLFVSNPPYIAPEERGEVMQEVLDFEPSQALFSPDGGVAHLAAAIGAASRALRTGGIVLLEHGASQGLAVRQLVHDTKKFSQVMTLQDLAGKERCTLARKA